MSKVTNAELHKLIADFKTEYNEGNKALSDKIDIFGGRLDNLDQRLDRIEENLVVHSRKFEEINEKIDEVDLKATDGINGLIQRVSKLENDLQHCQQIEIPAEMNKLREENAKLKDEIQEELENTNNRQLRRTLVFKNIPETKDFETYAEVKGILAETISSSTNISGQEVVEGIERAHREPKRAGGSRNGKRKIFAAFLNWELAQRVLEEFRQRCIADRTFDIYVEQMYGPLTTQRRNRAYEMRKRLKEQGIITSGYVEFPAKLMVNIAGDIGDDGKKQYKLHTNFSAHKIEK